MHVSASFGVSLTDWIEEVVDCGKDDDDDEEEEEELLYSLSDCSTLLSKLLFVSACSMLGARFIGKVLIGTSLFLLLSIILSSMFFLFISLYFF